MGKVALDTSVLIALDKNQTVPDSVLGPDDSLVIPVVALAELMVGAKHPERAESARERTRVFVQTLKQECEIVGVDEETASIFAGLRAHALAERKPRGINDLWIAAMAIQANAQLASMYQRARFEALPGLRLRT
jgi:tRNA(fMet)-specific endonuclease VapC